MSQLVVTRIPPKIPELQLGKQQVSTTKRQVCGYGRVSTDDKEQLTSYEAQIDRYTKMIQENEEWEFVGMYADEGTPYGQFPKSL